MLLTYFIIIIIIKQTTRQIYEQLGKRLADHPIFLQRTLRRNDDNNNTKQYQKDPNKGISVVYRSVEHGIVWHTSRTYLGCLWCHRPDHCYSDAWQLLHHLKMCHFMLNFALHNGTELKPIVTVNVCIYIYILSSIHYLFILSPFVPNIN